jgi:hypothetical protein
MKPLCLALACSPELTNIAGDPKISNRDLIRPICAPWAMLAGNRREIRREMLARHV